ncbi:MAG: hypothetical protein D6736_06430 [Nitrospinota bacterium]|nr:MAG: hypothetical protein D6736_06430 [Nitrospinota bacterium]
MRYRGIFDQGEWRRGLIIWGEVVAIMLLAFSLLSSLGEAQAWAENLCTKTSQAAFRSCQFETFGAFWLAIGNCDNLPTAAKRRACKRKARQEFPSGIEECQDQFEARQEVCEALGEGPYHPVINPADFVETIDNPFFPLTPGTTFIYEGAGEEHTEVFVTHETKEILGVTCIVVRDTVMVAGEIIEDTFDYYAQDREGNVWYFGELSQEFEDGELVSLAGSWKAGEDGAKPGIIMEADPQVGDVYRQEFALGEAEDLAEVLNLDASVIVPFGAFDHTLQTEDFSPLEPGVREQKFYAPGVGLVLEENPDTGERVELVDILQE